MKYYPDFHPIFTNGGHPEGGGAVNETGDLQVLRKL